MSTDEPSWTPPQQNPNDDAAQPPVEPTPPTTGAPPASPSQTGQPAGYPPPYGQSQPPPYGQSQPPYGQSQPPPYGQSQPPYGQEPYPTYNQYGTYGTGDPDKRPGTVTTASIITMVLSAIVGLLGLLGFVGLLVAKDDVIEAMRDAMVEQGVQEDVDLEAVYGVLLAVSLVFIAWCLIAFVLAIFVLRRGNVARILLVVSSAVTALLSLLAIQGGVSIVTLIGSIAVIVLLFVGGANEWFSRKGAQPVGGPTDQPW